MSFTITPYRKEKKQDDGKPQMQGALMFQVDFQGDVLAIDFTKVCDVISYIKTRGYLAKWNIMWNKGLKPSWTDDLLVLNLSYELIGYTLVSFAHQKSWFTSFEIVPKPLLHKSVTSGAAHA